MFKNNNTIKKKSHMKYKVSNELQINILFKCCDQVNAVANINYVILKC